MKALLALLILLAAGCGESPKPFAEAYVDYTTYHEKQYMPEREKGRMGINVTEGTGALFDFNISEAQGRIKNQSPALPGGMERLQDLRSSLDRAGALLNADAKAHKIALENHNSKLNALRLSLEASAKKEGREKDVPADDYSDYEKLLDRDIAASKVKLAALKARFNETIKAANMIDSIGLVK